MSDIDHQAATDIPEKRRPWEVPKVAAVVPVAFTQGGFVPRGNEGGIYYTIS